MSFALAHFSLGATISLLLFYHWTGKGNIAIALLGGFWAMIPDFPKLLPVPTFIFKGALCNIFFFHCLLDQLDSKDSVIVSVMLFGLFIITLGIIGEKGAFNES